MPERPRPDIEHTREALRRHDERAESEKHEREHAEPDESADEKDEDDEG